MLFIDHISKLKRDRVIKKFAKAQAREAQRLEIEAVEMPLRLDLHGHARFRGADADRDSPGAGHEIAAVYTRAPKPAGRGMELQATPVEREARRFGIPVLTPKTLRTDEALAEFRGASSRCRGRRRLRADPAEADPRSRAARLFQPARLAAAALARRRADQPRHHGGRCRDRRVRDEDGRRGSIPAGRVWRSASRSRPT